MRHVNYTLRPLTIDNAKPREKAYALTDGGGLLLEVLPSGTKTWRFKYHLNGKREKVTIGTYPLEMAATMVRFSNGLMHFAYRMLASLSGSQRQVDRVTHLYLQFTDCVPMAKQ